MPIFDYECRNCGEIFEEFVFSSNTADEDITCPSCGEKNAHRKLSAPAIGNSSSGSSYSGGCGHSGFT